MDQSKDYLNHPNRISTITYHRKFNKVAMMKLTNSSHLVLSRSSALKSQLPSKYCTLSAIYLKDMDKSEDHVYKGILKLTTFDDPMFGLSSVNFVVEDENHDVTRLSVYGIPHDKSTRKKLGFGTVIKIMNPFLRFAMDGRPGIRVDDPKTIFVVGKKKDMCRYCGKENAKLKCPECKRLYCEEDCLQRDWQIMDHRYVCKIEPFNCYKILYFCVALVMVYWMLF